MSFKNFIEAMVRIDKTRIIRKNWRKTYQPGTFGIEIEFRAQKEPEPEEEFDDFEAMRTFRNESESIPPEFDRWLEDNKEPEEPDPDDYVYDEFDPLANLYNLDMEKEPMDKPLPTALNNFSGIEFEQFFSDLPGRASSFMKKEVMEAVARIRYLYEGKGYLIPGRYSVSWTMLSSMSSLEEFIRRAEMQNNIGANRFQNQVYHQFGVGYQHHFNNQQVEYLRELQYAVQEALEDFSKEKIEKAKKINQKEYAIKIKEIWDKDMAIWQDEHDRWQQEGVEIEKQSSNYDEGEAFEKWLGERPSRFSRYATNRDRFMRQTEYEIDKEGVQEAVKEMEEWINNDDWKVFEDEPGIVEIASPILTSKEMGFLKSLLEYVSNKDFDTGTGLHVHIGMPATTDGFDLLAMAATIDEEAVLAMAGRTSSSINRYTKKKDSLFENLWRTLPNDGIISDEQLKNYMDINIDRYYGVNTIKAFIEHKTVELRYLSSQILDRRDGVEKLFRYINYFLMLPQLAQGRNQIRYDVQAGAIIFSRRPGGNTEIKRFPKDKKPSLPMSQLPVSDLRQQPEPDDRKIRLQQKFGPQSQSQIA